MCQCGGPLGTVALIDDYRVCRTAISPLLQRYRFDEAIGVVRPGRLPLTSLIFVGFLCRMATTIHQSEHSHDNINNSDEEHIMKKFIADPSHHDIIYKAAYFHVLADNSIGFAIVALVAGQVFLIGLWADASNGLLLGPYYHSLNWAYNLLIDSSDILTG